jgi:hypothetical protein
LLFRNLTLWKTGELVVSGSLLVQQTVTGNGLLEIADGGKVRLAQSTDASVQVEFRGAGTLALFEPQSFRATIEKVADGASIVVAGFAGAHESFKENSAGTMATVFLTGGGTLPTYDSLHFAGDFNKTEFQWNAATGTLTCNP